MLSHATMPAAGPYDDPAVYDILHTPGSAAELDTVQRLARRHLEAQGRGRRRYTWLEPACGTGRYLRLLARRGEHAVGFDRDPAMVAYARRGMRALGPQRRARVLVADMTRFADRVGPRRIDIAFNLVNTIRHLQNDAQMQAHLIEVARVLRAGGLYVVGMSLTQYGAELPSEDLWVGRRGSCRVTQLVQYLPPGSPGPRGRIETVISHLMIERPRGVEHRDATYDLRCYDAAQWRKLVERSPLRIVAAADAHGNPIVDWNTTYVVFLMRSAP
jgi:SAM-dependent methyltransferase